MTHELTVEIIVNFLLGGLLIWIGYLIHDRKNYQLIVGYNMLTDELQKRVDILKLARHVKNISTYSGILIAILPSTLRISGYYNWGIAFPLIIFAGLIYFVISFISCFQWKLDGNQNFQ